MDLTTNQTHLISDLSQLGGWHTRRSLSARGHHHQTLYGLVKKGLVLARTEPGNIEILYAVQGNEETLLDADTPEDTEHDHLSNNGEELVVIEEDDDFDADDSHKCPSCKEKLPLDAFGLRRMKRTVKDGTVKITRRRQSYCKACRRANRQSTMKAQHELIDRSLPSHIVLLKIRGGWMFSSETDESPLIRSWSAVKRYAAEHFSVSVKGV